MSGALGAMLTTTTSISRCVAALARVQMKTKAISFPDTRWVQLVQLVDNEIDTDAVAQLEKLAKALPKLVKAAARRIKEREAGGEEERA